MNQKLARTLDSYLTSDPYEYGPSDIGTDRPTIDQDAADAAERNAKATESAAAVRPVYGRDPLRWPFI